MQTFKAFTLRQMMTFDSWKGSLVKQNIERTADIYGSRLLPIIKKIKHLIKYYFPCVHNVRQKIQYLELNNPILIFTNQNR